MKTLYILLETEGNFFDIVQVTSIITVILCLIIMIVVINIRNNITKAANITNEFLFQLLGFYKTKIKCKSCGFETTNKTDFCPVCGKNENGKTLEELKKELS